MVEWDSDGGLAVAGELREDEVGQCRVRRHFGEFSSLTSFVVLFVMI